MSDIKETDYTQRKISKTTEDGKFTVSRSRDSDGKASIHIQMHGYNAGGILLTNEDHDFGDNYEQAALDLSRVLDDIGCNPCLLGENK